MKKISKILAVVLSVLMVLSAFPISAFALETEMEAAQEITVDQPFEVATFENGGHKWFKFIPEISGTYSFYSFNNDFDTRAYAYDSSGEFITEDDDGGENNNFKITLQMDAGETYYLNSRPFSEDYTGRYTVSIKKLQQAESFSIHNTEEIVVYKGVNFSIYPTFFPVDSVTEKLVTAEAETEGVLYTYAYEDYVDFSAENVGSTLLTVTTENGLTDTIEITVLEPEEITLNETKNYVIDSTYASQGYVFKPSKDGAYKVSITSENDNFYSITDLWDEDNNQIAYESGYDYYFTANLEAEKEYLIFSKNNTPNSNESSELSITIEEAVFPTAITINAPTEKIYKYQEFELDCTVEPANANVLNFDWYIEDYEIIGYNGDNCFYPLNIGTTTITAEVGNGVSDSIEIEISPYESISLNDTKTVSLENGVYEKRYNFTPEESGEYTFQFKALDNISTYYAVSDSRNNELDYTWDRMADINLSLEGGETYTVLILSYEEDCDVEFCVKKAILPETFEITNGDKGECFVGDSFYLWTEVTPENSAKLVTWTSSDEEVADCDQNGWVYVLSAGTATITATTSNGLSDTYEITVRNIPELELGTKYVYENENYEDMSMERRFVFTPTETGYYKFDLEFSGYCNGYVYSENGEQIGNFYEDFNIYLEADATYSLKFDFSKDLSLKASKTTGVKSVEILTLPKRIEYVKGHEEFSYYGLTAEVVLEDNTSVVYRYSYDETAAGYAVSFKDVYDENDNYERTDVVIGTVSDSFEFIIKENTIESIEYIGGEIKAIENDNGYYTEDYYGETFFCYNYHSLAEDIAIKINYTDKESVILNYGDQIDGYVISIYADQYDSPWTLGSDNYIEVNFLGETVEVPVTVVETPVRRIVVNTAPTRVYYQYDHAYGWLFDMFYPEFYDLTGLSFTVYFKDDTSETYTYEDIDEEGCIDGYYINIDHPYEAEPGNVEVTASYMGVEFNYNVVYKEFPYEIKDIKFAKLPQKLEYAQGFFPDFTGSVIEISYEDGSTKLVEVTENNIKYAQGLGEGHIVILVDVDGVALQIEGSAYYGSDSENTIGISYGDFTYLCEEFNFVKPKEITSIEASGIRNILINVKYADGTSEIIDPADSIIEMYGCKYVLTSQGITLLYMFEENDESNNTKIYEMYMFGEEFYYEVKDLAGDVNGDGDENAADLALLKKVIAGLTPIDDEDVKNPDVDGSGGNPNAADLALLKKIIARLV